MHRPYLEPSEACAPTNHPDHPDRPDHLSLFPVSRGIEQSNSVLLPGPLAPSVKVVGQPENGHKLQLIQLSH